MMLSRLIEKAKKKGYTVAKIPERVFGFTLPEWFSFKYEFWKKNICYSPESLVSKWMHKRARREERRRKDLFKMLTGANIHPRNPYKF